MTLKIEKIVNELKTLTLLEAVSLVKEIEAVFGVDISSANNIANTFATQKVDSYEIAAPLILEEKTSFDIILSEVPSDKKIPVLKVIRNVTGLGLKESKDIIDNVPKVVKESVTKEESDLIKKDFEAAGAKIIIK